jgi:hypothetical protein
MKSGIKHASVLSNKTSIAVVAAAGLGLAGQAHAAIVSLPSNLQVLTSGNSAKVATLTFDDWGYLGSPSGVTAIKAQNVGVNSLIQPGDDGVTFSTLWSATKSYEDSDVTFHVSSTSPIVGVDLHFDGKATKGTLAQVVETVMDSQQHTVAQMTVYADGTHSVLDQVINFAPGVSYSDLYITKDISVSSLKSTTPLSDCEGKFVYDNSKWGGYCDTGHGGLATISTVSNTFITLANTGGPGVPEPASLAVLGLGASGLLLRRRKA